MADAIIIGAGPAGSSCALWLAKLGFSPILADAASLAGGLLNDSPFRNDWIVTQPGVTGPDLAEGIGLALAAAGVPMLLGARAANALRTDEAFAVMFDLPSGKIRAVSAPYLVIATGVRPRQGGLEPSPRMLFGPGQHVFEHDFAGQSVAILGGGDNAFENYDFVKRAGASEAHIYARTVRAGRVFRDMAATGDVLPGPYEVEGTSGKVNGRAYDVILVMYGWEPAPVFAGELGLARDQKGYLSVDFATCRTNVPGVYGIGEVAARGHPCVVTAMADGITAAKDIQRLLESR
jgi:thioredoxin reductase (NADPH)